MAYRVRQGREFVVPPTGLSYTGAWVPYLFPLPLTL
jgi:citrate synthase